MAKHPFRLGVFQDMGGNNKRNSSVALDVHGWLLKTGTGLVLKYIVQDTNQMVVWPPENPQPTRCDNLWQHTCFELFLSRPGGNEYTEYNLSPSLDWNAYNFTTYRKLKSIAQCDEPQLTNTKPAPGVWEMLVTLPLCPPISLGRIDIGVACVLEFSNTAKQYYALAHTAIKPDFHRRDSFILKLE